MTGMLRRLPTSGSRRQRRTANGRFRQAGAHFKCVTIQAYESYAYDPSYRRTAGMAEGNIAEDGNSGWKTGPSTIGERSFARRNPAISASRWGDSWRPGRCFFSERVLALM